MFRNVSESAEEGSDFAFFEETRALAAQMKSRHPSYLSGWTFLSVVESEEEDAIGFKAVAHPDGPRVEYNSAFFNRELLEDPAVGLIWVPAALYGLCTEMLHQVDEEGLFRSPKWSAMRNAACHHMCMEWSEIIDSTERRGVRYMAETLASALFIESGLMDILHKRQADKNSQLKFG